MPQEPLCWTSPTQRHLFMNATLDFPRLTATEEAELILQDVFDEDETDIKLSVIEVLCAEEGIPFEWQAKGKGKDKELAHWDDIVEAIIEREDDLYLMADAYRNTF